MDVKPKHYYIVQVDHLAATWYTASCTCGWRSQYVHLGPDGYAAALGDFAAHIMPFVREAQESTI